MDVRALEPDKPAGLHFSEAEITASVERMREHLRQGAGPKDAHFCRAAEVFLLGDIRLLPEELNRGTTPAEFGAAVTRAMGWMVAQMSCGAPSLNEAVGSAASITAQIGRYAGEHLVCSVVKGYVDGVQGEVGGHG